MKYLTSFCWIFKANDFIWKNNVANYYIWKNSHQIFLTFCRLQMKAVKLVWWPFQLRWFKNQMVLLNFHWCFKTEKLSPLMVITTVFRLQLWPLLKLKEKISYQRFKFYYIDAITETVLKTYKNSFNKVIFITIRIYITTELVLN